MKLLLRRVLNFDFQVLMAWFLLFLDNLSGIKEAFYRKVSLLCLTVLFFIYEVLLYFYYGLTDIVLYVAHLDAHLSY